MLDVLLLAFAVLWAWEFVLVISPVRIPAFLQPILVAGIAYGGQYVPRAILLAAAVAGMVALLHLVVRKLADDDGPALTQVIGRRSRIPDLP